MDNFYWYTLKINATNEEDIVNAINEQVSFLKLQDSIVDVKFYKEYKIEKGDEIAFNSELMPKRPRNSANNVWVRLANNNIINIRCVTKKPFRGLIFIKMKYDFKLFKEIKSWFLRGYFLGDANPIPISELQFKNMIDCIEHHHPIDVVAWAKEEKYEIYEIPIPVKKATTKSKSKKANKLFEGIRVVSEEEILDGSQRKVDLDFLQENVKTSKTETVIDSSNQKEEIIYKNVAEEETITIKTSEISEIIEEKKILSNETVIPEVVKEIEAPKPSTNATFLKNNNLFSVNDEVLVKMLGTNGIIQSIDQETRKIVILINFFGRQQIINSTLDDIEKII